MTLESLDEHLARLERERQDADRAYNDALTALDRAIGDAPGLPHPPPPYDASALAAANQRWNILDGRQPVVDGSLRGRLRGFIWRIVAPLFEQQREFNAQLVDHLNRNVVAHEEAQKAITTTIALTRAEIERVRRLHAHLIQYLQTITLYVDTKDRASGAMADVLNAGLSAITDDFLKRWESLGAREIRLTGRFDDVRAHVEDLRATAVLAQQTALSLKREVERMAMNVTAGLPVAVVGATAPVADLNAFKYVGFENEFRGAPQVIRGRLETYLPLFDGLSDVLDIGCGRGEFLDLLRSQGITARGIDINDAMVEESRARGLDASRGDALSYLQGLPDGSLGGVFAAQVVEHLPPDYLTALIEVAVQKIRPGGRIVLETINPSCWVAFFESYIRDLTHVRPLHPDTLQYLLRVSGFQEVGLKFLSPVAPTDRLQRLAAPAPDASQDVVDIIVGVNDTVDRLNGRLFTYQDYAVVARR